MFWVGSFIGTVAGVFVSLIIVSGRLDEIEKRYIKVLCQAKSALKYCTVSACRPAQGVAEVVIEKIDKLVGRDFDV